MRTPPSPAPSRSPDQPTDPELWGPDPEVARTLHLKRGPPRWPWLLALGVAVAATIAVVVGANRVDAPGRWDYETGEAVRGSLTVRVTAVGRVKPLNAVQVSSELSGIVQAVLVDLDQRVEAGDILARLDASVLQAQGRQADAAVSAAQAGVVQGQVSLDAAKRELARSESIARDGALPAAELERAGTAVDAARAAVAMGEAQLAQAQAAARVIRTQLRKTVIRSPMDGVILERNVEPGQAVVSALQVQTLFVVADDLDQMEVEVDIDEADIGRLAPGQTAEFSVAAHPDRVFQATVRQVHLSPKPSLGVVTYLAELDAANPDGALRPGLTATAHIDTATLQDVLLLPNRALRWSPQEADSLDPPKPREGRRVARVWVLQDGEPAPREVLPGASDGQRTVIEPGDVEPGVDVIVGAKDRRAARKP